MDLFGNTDNQYPLGLESPSCSVGLETTIDRNPLLVLPEIELSEAIKSMSQEYEGNGKANSVAAMPSRRASYTLVVESSKLVGIVTERDIVKLTAQRTNLEGLKVADVMTRQLITVQEEDLGDCLAILGLLRKHKIRHLPVVDSQQQVIGVATHDSICRAVQPTVLLKLRQVSEVMSIGVVSAKETASVIELAELMASHRVSCVVITNSEESPGRDGAVGSPSLKPVGIVTERDIVQYQSFGLDLEDTLAQTVMSAPLTCLNPTDSLWAAREAMQKLRVRRLVIADANQALAGILTQTSLLSVLNPVDLCTTVDILKQQLDQLQSEKVELLSSLNESLSAQVKNSEAIFQATFEQAAAGIVHVDLQGNFFQVNQKFCDIVGYSRAELLTKSVSDITASDSLEDALKSIQQLMRREISSFSHEKQYRRRNGELVWASVTVSRVITAADDNDYMVAVIEDIDARKAVELELSLYQNRLHQLVEERTAALQSEIDRRKRVEQQLFAEKELAQVTLQSIGDAVVTTNAECQVIYLNSVAEKLTGWMIDEALGRQLSEVFEILNETTREPVQDPVERVLSSGCSTGLANNTILVSRNGTEYSIDDSAAPLRNREGVMIGAVLIFRDATHARKISRQLSWQAGHDALTSLVNRRKFEQILKAAYESVGPGQQHVLCYLDLDQFKVVNDTCGHTAGDELLRQVSALLNREVRAADTLARLGGDEFAILLKQCPIEKAVIIANQIRTTISDFRFVWRQETFQIGVSIGLVTIDSQSLTIADMLGAADAACYSAKSKGRNQVQVYQPNAAEIVEKRGQQRWSLRIRQALEQGRFCLHQQRIVPTVSGDKAHAYSEILLRMIDEEAQLISPAVFIPAAERYDMMPDIDRWVVRTFFTYLSNCRDQSLSVTHPLLYMINLSGASVGNEQFLSFLKEQLDVYAISPTQICFEITETAAISNLNQAIDFIRELKQLGFCFALDDFGSGMSSFAYLKTLPVDYIKIDGKFITDIGSDPTALTIVEAINDIAHVMGLKTIAEFVETEQVQNSLREVGVDFMQGYGIEEPHAFM